MPIYIYETIPAKKGQKVRRFEIEQRMSDEQLKKEDRPAGEAHYHRRFRHHFWRAQCDGDEP